MPRKDRGDNCKDWIEFQNRFRYITERGESRHTTIKLNGKSTVSLHYLLLVLFSCFMATSLVSPLSL